MACFVIGDLFFSCFILRLFLKKVLFLSLAFDQTMVLAEGGSVAYQQSEVELHTANALGTPTPGTGTATATGSATGTADVACAHCPVKATLHVAYARMCSERRPEEWEWRRRQADQKREGWHQLACASILNAWTHMYRQVSSFKFQET